MYLSKFASAPECAGISPYSHLSAYMARTNVDSMRYMTLVISFMHITWWDVLLQLDNGTNHAQAVHSLNLSSSKKSTAFNNYISNLVIDNSLLTPDIVADIHKHYPAHDSTARGRFHTGDSLHDRAASWYTDEIAVVIQLKSSCSITCL